MHSIRLSKDEELGFEPGDTVFHKEFGEGIVQKTYQTSLGLTYDVFFPQARSSPNSLSSRVIAVKFYSSL
jgi:hypothetical protein